MVCIWYRPIERCLLLFIPNLELCIYRLQLLRIAMPTTRPWNMLQIWKVCLQPRNIESFEISRIKQMLRTSTHAFSFALIQLPSIASTYMDARAKNMFSRDFKRLWFRCKTLKFPRPKLKGHCHGLICASVGSKTWKSQPDVFKLNTRTFNMASTSGGSGQGDKRNNSGRKREYDGRGQYKKAWSKSHKRIYLEERSFKSQGWTLLRMSTRDSVSLSLRDLKRLC